MKKLISLVGASVMAVSVMSCTTLRGTGDLGMAIERSTGRVLLLDTTSRSLLSTIDGLGDLSHASIVFSRDGRYGFVFGRDGGLTKVDLLKSKIVARVIQSGNSIGGAISQDGSLVAVSNYKPGGVNVFRSSDLSLVKNIPATVDGTSSKVIGLVDAPGQKFVFSLFEAGEIWVSDFSDLNDIQTKKFKNVGKFPYDGLITGDGRHYVAGLFGEKGIAVLDLWHLDRGVRKALRNYGKGDKKLPVYKMPHLEGWAMAGEWFFLPGVGQHEVLVVDQKKWGIKKRIKLKGQPVFAMADPTGRNVWVNFAFPDNKYLQIIDVETLKVVKTLEPGKGVLHMEFTPRGENVWVSLRDEGRIDIYDTKSFNKISEIKATDPSGIFFSSRANKIGL